MEQATSPNPQSLRPGDRIQSLDVLRGFALFGILVVNMAVFSGPALYRSGAQLPAIATPLDQIADTFVATFASGKFFPLFSFLFGVGLAIQLLSWQAKDAPATRLFLRRLSCLLLIGLGHATFIWAGDILAKYAALGLLFLLALRLPPRYLLVGSGALLLLPFLLGWLGADSHLPAIAGLPITPAEFRQQIDTSMAVYGHGSFWEMTQQRLVDYRYRLFAWTYVTGMFTILAMFCLGAYAGRTGVFRAQAPALFRRIAFGAMGGWCAAMAITILAREVPGVVPPQAHKVVNLVHNLSSTALYVSGIVLLLESATWRARLAPLALAGRMALTNYLLQSVLATAIFYGAGFYGTLGSAACLSVAVVIFTFQVVASRLWLDRFRFGPVEWLWRWVTYGERPPMRRSSPETPQAVAA